MNAVILPVGFSDHHLVLFDLNMKTITKPNYFWHFNVKLLQDAFFCDSFKLFWNKWKMQKDSFENMCQWWDVGKVNIRIFCQNYSSYNTSRVKFAVESLEKDTQRMESTIFNNNGTGQSELLNKKRKNLARFYRSK